MGPGDLGPFARVLAPGQGVFSSKRIQRKYKAQTVTYKKDRSSKIQKRPRPTATPEGPGAKARYCA